MNLLPCPFCGGKARLCYPHQRATTEVMCLTCGALVPGQDDTHAAEAWNLRRATVPASEPPACGECDQCASGEPCSHAQYKAGYEQAKRDLAAAPASASPTMRDALQRLYEDAHRVHRMFVIDRDADAAAEFGEAIQQAEAVLRASVQPGEKS